MKIKKCIQFITKNNPIKLYSTAIIPQRKTPNTSIINEPETPPPPSKSAESNNSPKILFTLEKEKKDRQFVNFPRLDRYALPFEDATRTEFLRELRTRNFPKCWQLFRSLGPAGRFSTLKPEDFTLYLGFLTSCSRPAQGAAYSKVVLEKMVHSRYIPDVRDFNSHLFSLIKNEEYANAIDRFMVLAKGGYFPSTKKVLPNLRSFHLILYSVGRSDSINIVLNYFRAMTSSLRGADLDYEAAALLIEAYGKSGMIDRAKAVADKMRQIAIFRLDNARTKFASALNDRPQSEQESEKRIDIVNAVHYKTMSDVQNISAADIRKFSGNYLRVLDALVKVYAENKRIDLAVEVYRNWYAEAGSSPGEDCYDALISGWELENRLDIADYLWDELVERSDLVLKGKMLWSVTKSRRTNSEATLLKVNFNKLRRHMRKLKNGKETKKMRMKLERRLVRMGRVLVQRKRLHNGVLKYYYSDKAFQIQFPANVVGDSTHFLDSKVRTELGIQSPPQPSLTNIEELLDMMYVQQHIPSPHMNKDKRLTPHTSTIHRLMRMYRSQPEKVQELFTFLSGLQVPTYEAHHELLMSYAEADDFENVQRVFRIMTQKREYLADRMVYEKMRLMREARLSAEISAA